MSALQMLANVAGGIAVVLAAVLELLAVGFVRFLRARLERARLKRLPHVPARAAKASVAEPVSTSG